MKIVLDTNVLIHSQANYLVSGDSDLKVLESEFPSKIISLRDFLNIIVK